MKHLTEKKSIIRNRIKVSPCCMISTNKPSRNSKKLVEKSILAILFKDNSSKECR